MSKGICISLAVVFSIVFCGISQEKPSAPQVKNNKRAAKPIKVNVRFVDGSNVVMVLEKDELKVTTKHGKLTVEPSDVREIQFGVHLTEKLEKEIKRALKELGSNQFRKREAAQMKLVELGPYSYISVRHVANDNDRDLETISRAQAVASKIKQRFAPEQLRVTRQDRVRTGEFSFKGRLLNASIKARSRYFGSVNLNPTDLLSIRVLADGGRANVTLDAATYASQTRRWFDTGIRVDSKKALTIRASGTVDLWPQTPGQYMSTPDGYGHQLGLVRGAGIGPGTTGGLLMGRIGKGATSFVVGSRYNGRPNLSGKLYLSIMPSPWNNESTGSYKVKIQSGSNLFDD